MVTKEDRSSEVAAAIAIAVQHFTNNIYVRTAPSPIEGVGTFAIKEIPNGINPFKHPPIDAHLWIPFELLSGVPDAVREMMERFWTVEERYQYVELYSCMNFACLDYAYINHSGTPNLLINHAEDGTISWTTQETIAIGDELTEDYDFL